MNDIERARLKRDIKQGRKVVWAHHDFSVPMYVNGGLFPVCARCLGVTQLSVSASGPCPGRRWP